MAKALGAAVAVRVARALYRQWEALAPAERTRLEPLATDVKERALEVRGKVDGGQAERELEAASADLAEALGADEVAELRGELRRELERIEREQRARRAA
jgi:hypothetical protein